MTFSVMVNTDSSLAGTAELEFGVRNLQRFLAATVGFKAWQNFDARGGVDSARALCQSLGTDSVMVILNPALVACNNFASCMAEVLALYPQRVVVAADPRSASGEWQIDYASRAGLERYVNRRAVLPQCEQALALDPWLFMVRSERLLQMLDSSQHASWRAVSELVRDDALVAQHAFVHSFASYQSSDRADIWSLVPAHARRLMDVGGGEGWFLSGYMAGREAEGLLVEPSAGSAAAALSRGLRVANMRFDEVSALIYGQFDCISFLDVMEHLENPYAALQHARSLLAPGGAVLLSIPNVGHWSVVEDLLNGRFDYLPLGILCNTHLRFFTESSLRELLVDAGFRIVCWRNQPSAMPGRIAEGLAAARAAGLPLNLTSLETESFHVLAEIASVS